MDPLHALTMRYHAELVEGVKALTKDIGYRAPLFTRMLGQYGGVETTRRLLRGAKTHEGFLILFVHQRLDRSVEAWMLRPEFTPLFDDEERRISRERLEAHGFDVDRYLREVDQTAYLP
ncbi:hypothetical protein [Hamadaea tsunoensis]|uniref:hypothetical protein n=1 Tax=Hamadaea tsunoensis TaxID=53368 RepID=UPI00040B345E|nr:hypothetical protein [Hamadaea tsunoensis]